MKKRLTNLLLTAILLISGSVFAQQYNYQTFKNDPLNTRLYTLQNGLKVYMTVNKEEPRIQTYIPVRVGGKNDPFETTGLAHYFEHLMFKGSEKFGTQNYAAEKPLLDEIERLFEVYRKQTDPVQRKATYHQIDSLSYIASKYAIPNEYDKLMSAIGAKGTNAFTGYDQTVYVENIPSNQIENWAKIQADRFGYNVIRGFHTELETVYEEKNMSLTRDSRKVGERLMAALYPSHPYGKQTVLGTQENLKNPSITNIKNYYKNWYVPNNMAICLSGDFNPDEMIRTIDKYFGSLQPNPNLKHLTIVPEKPITEPVKAEVLGLEAPSVTMGWRAGGAATDDPMILEMIDMILNNGKAGLIDLNLIQKQKVLAAGSGANGMADYTTFQLYGTPKQGQSLEEVRDLLLGEITKLRKGEFDESLIQSTVNNFKLQQLRRLENNSSRAMMFVESFISGTNWQDEVNKLEKISKITKQQIVEFANANLKDNNYAIVYKRQGKDPNELKIEKPQITPIVMNRDASSDFMKEIQNAQVSPIEPVFVDFSKDMKVLKAKSTVPVYYKQNETNDIFNLVYVYDFGSQNDKTLSTAADLLNYLGTSKMTPEQIKSEFYKLACNYSVNVGMDRTMIGLNGLSENMDKAVTLLETLLADAKADNNTYSNMANNVLKERANAKANQGANFSRLVQYGIYGPNNPSTNLMSEAELKSANPQTLLNGLKSLNNLQHRVLYYGPMTSDKFITKLNALHKIPAKLKEVSKIEKFKQLPTTEDKVILAEYDAKQLYLRLLSNRGEKFNNEIFPVKTMYDEYFGGGMNAIVFQEMREARGLAYSANAFLSEPRNLQDNYVMNAQIATQNDKLNDALTTFEEIINDMPVSENAFNIAKNSLESRLRTNRVSKMGVLQYYMNLQDLGINYDRNATLYQKLKDITLDDVKAFQEKWIKGRKYTTVILGNEKDLDINKLNKRGKVVRVSQKDIFGY